MKPEKHPLERDPPMQVILLTKTGWHVVDFRGELPQSKETSPIRSYEYEGVDTTGPEEARIMVILTMHVDMRRKTVGTNGIPS